MTRDGDSALYDEHDRNKKMADMKARCDLINETSPLLTVSIHQNSYHEESVNGGQVFYYKNSAHGKQLAEILQRPSPTVIVECGFLSNRNEASLLGSEEYQDRLAWTIHMGIMEYINTQQPSG